MKKTLIPALVTGILGFVGGTNFGCTSPNAIDASVLQPVTDPVIDRHDSYVNDDPNLSDADRELYLRSSELLRSTIREALPPVLSPEGE